MKTKIRAQKSATRPLSFEEAIVRRAAQTHRHQALSIHHRTIARFAAVDDEWPLPMIHYRDVGSRGGLS